MSIKVFAIAVAGLAALAAGAIEMHHPGTMSWLCSVVAEFHGR